MAHADANQLSDGRPAGTVLGQAAADLVGFHGTDPTDQSPTSSAVSTSALVLVSGAYGFATEAQATTLIATVNLLRGCLREKGLMA